MRLQTVASTLALAGSTAAFSDSWPLVMFSTSEFAQAPNSNQIQTTSQALEYVKDVLSSCPTDRYLLVTQPGINVADLRKPDTTKAWRMPRFAHLTTLEEVKGKHVVPEVVGDAIEMNELNKYIQDVCAEHGKDIETRHEPLWPLEKDQDDSLNEQDRTVQEMVQKLRQSKSYTVLYVGTPRAGEKKVYEPEFVEPGRVDLKRSLMGSTRRDDNETVIDRRPLFQKYQFFTPGIFMAIITAIVLFSILGVGLRALASLEVSYGAFDKEMGPAAQKKQ
ncbi:hypothetical protein ACJ41O_013687 [Fusarium nematophilum]